MVLPRRMGVTVVRRVMLAAMLAGMLRLGTAATINYNWIGGVGEWSNPFGWAPPAIPNCSAAFICNVFLTDTSQFSAVTLSGPGASVTSLTLNSMANLVVDAARLTLGNSSGAGAISNQGIIALENAASLVLDVSAATGPISINNSGQIELDATSSFQITDGGKNIPATLSGAGSFIMSGGTLSGSALVNNSTIRGSGTVQTLVINQGTINNDSGLLTIYASTEGLKNSGTILAGNLTLDASSAYASGQALLDNAKYETSAVAGDREIRKRVLAEMERNSWAPSALVDVAVDKGVVRFTGTILDERDRAALKVLAENVPGVRAVRDELLWVEPFSLSGVALGPEESESAGNPKEKVF